MTAIARPNPDTRLPVRKAGDPRVRNARARSRYWRMQLAQLARPVSLEPLPPVGSSREFELGVLRVAHARFGACGLVRDDAMIERSRLRSHVLVALFLHGSMRGTSPERDIHLRRGDIGFFDLAQAGTFEASNASCIALLVPRWMLHGQVHGLVMRESGLPGKMLSRHLQQLLQSLPAPSHVVESSVQSTLSVLQLCVDFTPPEDARGGIDPLRGSVLAYIDANLEDPRLGPEMLAARFGISRTWLYRVFSGSGGVKRCIRDKRLDAAFRDLCASPDRRIIDVACQRGFSSERQFQRAFMQRFGSTPSDVRDRTKAGSPTDG